MKKAKPVFDPAVVVGIRLPDDMPENVRFGVRGVNSPYADLVQQLLNAPEGSALEFKDSSPKNSLCTHAKRQEVKLEFAELNGRFFARISGDASAPRVKRAPTVRQQQADGKMSITEAVRVAVREAPRTNAEIKDRVEELLPGTKREAVDGYLFTLKGNGEIAKAGVHWKYTGTGAPQL